MIIETIKQLDIQSISGNVESIDANINSASMPFLFEILSGSLYSNAIGSICREITSNCFDSHIEANVDDPVTIKKGWDEEGYYISFIDVGIGLSPDRIKSIYMNYFSSTKRETNNQIGGFGLGSKSPLSYSDYFYITTIYNGIKYQYIFSKGKSIPSLDLLNTFETIDRNGTEIKIYIKDDDVYKFKDELIKQLCYFDNVYFENWNIDNDYTIFEGTYFKYRNKNQYSTKMHIVIDKVVYPIDWKQLDIKEYNIDVGIKFQIGELLVTPNREQLRYTDEIITLVKERINLAINELTEIFNKQNKQFDSFFEWLNKKNEKPYINFTKDNIVYKLYLYGLEHISKRNIYKHFEGIEDIINIDDIVSMFFSYASEIKNGKKKKYDYIPNLTSLVKNNSYNCYISNNNTTTLEKDWLLNNGYILYPKLNVKKYKSIFGTVLSSNSIFGTASLNNSTNSTNSTNLNNYKYYHNLGSGLRLYKLMKAIREEIILKCKTYRNLTESELLEYKDYKKSNNYSLQRKLNETVLVKSISENSSYDWSLTKPLLKYQTKSINNYTGIVIYGFIEDQLKLDKAMTLLYCVRRKYFNKSSVCIGNNKAFKVIKISKQNEKYFKKRNNMFHVDKLYGDNPMFRDMASSFKIEHFFNDININSGQNTLNYINKIKLISNHIGSILQKLYNFYINSNTIKYDRSDITYDRSDIRIEVIQIAEKYNLYNPIIELLFNDINNWFKDIEIIRYININDKSLPFILKLLYEKKKKMNIEYYQKVLNTDKTIQLEIDFNKVESVSLTKFQVLTNNVII